MHTRYNLIWDLDGTLFDSYANIVGNVIRTYAETGIALDEAEILRYVKNTSCNDFFVAIEKEKGISSAMIRKSFAVVNETENGGITLIAHAEEVLAAMKAKGCRHFVFTHRGSSTGRILAALGIDGYFDEVITVKDGFPRKPDGGAIVYLLEKYRMNKDRTFYIGDRALDMACAVNAGIRGIMYIEEGSVVKPSEDASFIISELTELEHLMTSVSI